MKSILPIRKRLRLKNYDYSKQGMYFITICVQDRIELLGKIVNENNMKLTNEGNIVERNICQIEQIYKDVILDKYVIMPNHIHMIIILNKNNNITISRLIKQYKMYVSKETKYSFWQKSYYEHIIRNEKEYLKISEYIKNNIRNWKQDKYC